MTIFRTVQVYNSQFNGTKGSINIIHFNIHRFSQNSLKLPAIIDTSIFYSDKYLALIENEKEIYDDLSPA